MPGERRIRRISFESAERSDSEVGNPLQSFGGSDGQDVALSPRRGLIRSRKDDEFLEEDHLDDRSHGLLLLFQNPILENKFWDFTVPTLPTGEQLMIAGTTIFTAVFVLSGFDYDGHALEILPRVVFPMSIAVFFLAGVNFAAYSLKFILLPTARRCSRLAVLLNNFLVLAIGMNHHFLSDRVGSCSIITFVDDERQYYYRANCYRFFQPWPAVSLAMLALLQLSFRSLLAVAAAYNVVTVLFVTLLGSRRHPTLAYAYIGNNLVLSGFILFLRFHAESTERRYFKTHIGLQESIHRLTSGKKAINEFCERILPLSILRRARAGQKSRRLDQSDHAVVLSVAIHDFGRQASNMLPLELASAVEYIKQAVTALCARHNVERVAVVQDELIAVANLLDPMGVSSAICACSRIALESLEYRDDLPGLPPLTVGVNEGKLFGGFIGNAWIRYDISGPAL